MNSAIRQPARPSRSVASLAGFVVVAAYLAFVAWSEATSYHSDWRATFGSLKIRGCAEIDCVKAAIGLNAESACFLEARRQAKRDLEWRGAVRGDSVRDFRWKDRPGGTVTVSNTNATLENIAGIPQTYDYECDVDPAAGKIEQLRLLSVRGH